MYLYGMTGVVSRCTFFSFPWLTHFALSYIEKIFGQGEQVWGKLIFLLPYFTRLLNTSLSCNNKISFKNNKHEKLCVCLSLGGGC